MTGGGVTDAADRAALHASVRERNAGAARIAALLIAVINPCFGFLDRILIPSRTTPLLFIRLGVEALAVVVLYLVFRARSFVRANDMTLGLGMMAVVSWSIEAMVFLHDGYSSPYYAGICLVTVATGYLFLVTARTAAAFHAAVYAPFIAPALLGLVPVTNPALFFTHQLFLLSTILIVYVSQRFRYELEEREFYANLALQRTQSSLQDALESLKKMDQLKSQFFSNITHELRTPLTLILAPLESMRTGGFGQFTKEQLEPLDGIWKNGIRLLKLINDRLDLARMSENFLYLQVEQTSLKDTVSSVVDYARPLAARKQLALEFEIQSESTDLHCDVEKMERVVVNLLSNALKFTAAGGRVSVTLGSRAGMAFIAVTDSGIGVPQDKVSSIFERFTQADASVTRRYGGTGIGLASAESIVKLHGGSIEVESTVGVGSTFTVLLPLGSHHFDPKLLNRRQQDEPGPGHRARRSEDQGPREWAARLTDLEEYRFLNIEEATERRRVRRGPERPSASRILVVEDNLDVAEFLQVHLQQDHTVFVAGNGREGLSLAVEKRPDAIVSDYMMPEMDGLEMLRQLRQDERTAGIPVIMLTAKSQLGDRLDALDAGADAYLAKPFSPQELSTTIAQQLAKRGHQAQNLRKANARSLGVVSAGLSHEINNPLNYIRTASAVVTLGLSELTTQLREIGGEHLARAQVIEARLERMCKAIDVGVLKIQRVVELMRRYAQEGYAHAALPVQFDAAIRDVAAVILPRGEKRVNVELCLDAEGSEVVMVAEELHQAVSNLVQNAVDAVGDGGHVIIRTRSEKATLVLEVVDDGPGIAPEARDRIFTPFFTTKDPGEGMGLGLAITQKVVEDAGGSIDVDSIVGSGTTFRVSLPRLAAQDLLSASRTSTVVT
jgi:signal transduction histidine kinase